MVERDADDASDLTLTATAGWRTWQIFVGQWGLSTIIILAFAWAGFAGERIDAWMCNVGGMMGSYEGFADNDFAVVEIWQHGWPFVFLERHVEFYPSNPFAVWHGFLAFRWLALVGDLLILGAIVGLDVAMRLMQAKVAAPRKSFSLSLRMLFVLVSLVCLAAGSLGASYARSQRERGIGARLEQLGHHVEYEYVGPIWFSRFFGRDLAWLPLQGVKEFSVGANATTDWPEETLLAGLGDLAELRCLNLGNSPTDDEGLRRLLAGRRQWSLQELHFYETPISGSAFENCKSLSQLRHANGWGSKLNDEGVAALVKLPNVEWINAKGTDITNQAVDSALEAPRLQDFDFDETNVDRASLQRLIDKGIGCRYSTDTAY
ncbi:leucine-rich repeat domain-containing protein [Blastopirellula retiformator]|uniref:Leucine Rich repeats (2 copies) n=1 Tax=Blastopirellula retiformator TaxID=2527970 RepID=A0A5C5VNU0_9BACT|nr:hypothetical protein [Blastopirellula retiformator]TWT39585.1 hypothetical protein Enr8_12850 [Blastopirellula retiformator]